MQQEAWLKYLHASGYALRRYKRGPFKYRLQPKSDLRRAAALAWFATEQDLLAHLQRMAGNDLRRDAQMHMDAAYAVTSGDHAFLNQQLDGPRTTHHHHTPAGVSARGVHRKHLMHAKTCAVLFQSPRLSDLAHAARLHWEFRRRDPAAQYRCRLDQAQAWFEAKALADTLQFDPPPKRESRVPAERTPSKPQTLVDGPVAGHLAAACEEGGSCPEGCRTWVSVPDDPLSSHGSCLSQ